MDAMMLNGWELDVLEETTEGREADVLILSVPAMGVPLLFFFSFFFCSFLPLV